LQTEYGHGSFGTGTREAHLAAKDGDTITLMKIVNDSKHLVHAKGLNGWTPLHEAAHSGHVGVMRVLVTKGANINEWTNNGSAVTPLWLAMKAHGEDHSVVSYLQSGGTESLGPEL